MVTNPIYDPYLVLMKVYSEGAHLKQALADVYIEEIHRARTVKIVYGVLEQEEFLSFCIHRYAEKSPKLAVRTLLKIALYMMLFMEKKRYMVTDFAVALCKKLGKSGVSGFVNAFLRKFKLEEVEGAIPQGEEGDAIRLSYPLYAYQKLKKEYGKRADAIAKATSQGLCVRFEKNEDKYPAKDRISTPFEGAYIYSHFVREEGFFEGDYTFQSVGSIAICDVVSGCKKLLDACAAPGGKSVLLSKKCDEVTAFELHPHRVELIKQYQDRMGRKNITALQKDSRVLDERYIEQFDGVLCDVPCSGFGTVTENPDIKLFRKAEDFASLQGSQREIISICSNYVKKGGNLYYSTCSIFAEENDEVVAWFLEKHPDFFVEEMESPLSNMKKKYGLQFLPDEAFGAGFYVAKLRRREV